MRIASGIMFEILRLLFFRA